MPPQALPQSTLVDPSAAELSGLVLDPSGIEPSLLEPSVSELSGSGVMVDPSSDSAMPRQDASLLLSEDAIKQLKESAARPLPADDSGLILSDSAILQLGKAAVAPQPKKPDKGPDKGPDALSPSGILRMAAGLRLDTEDATRADQAAAEALAKLTAPTQPKARPAAAAPVALSNLPTALLSPIALTPPEDRTSLDVDPAGAKKRAPDDMAETAIRQLPGPITVHNPKPLPAGAAPIMSRPTSTGMVIVPAGTALGGDIELPPEEPTAALDAGDRKALLTRKAESTAMLGDASMAGQPPPPAQKPPYIENEATAIRPVFQRFGAAEPRAGRSISPTAVMEDNDDTPRGGFFSLKLLIGLLILGAVGAGGWFGANWYLRDQKVRQLASSARSAYDSAFEHGRLADFVKAEAQLRVLGDTAATDEAARQARALILNAARFEFGGGPPIASDSDWEQESLGAVRLIETERSAVALATLVLANLAQGELTAAEQHLEALQSANTGEGRYRLPNGMVDYLASQVALLGGRDEQAVLALQRAVQKQRLAMWQRRLGYLLLRSGRDEEAIVSLTAAQKREDDLIGAQIDLAYARGRGGKREIVAESKQLLRGLIEPPASGPDPAGRSEHARAALLLADLTLRADPAARAEARELLKKAQAKAVPTDVLFQEELAQAHLRIGDGEAAAAIVRELVMRLPQRRTSRILLARALIAAKQGGDALSALGPLIEPKEKGQKLPPDPEAQLLRAQGLFLSHDTLAAQQAARHLISSTPASSREHVGAQLLTAEMLLTLGEPVAARRNLEPLMRLVEKTKPGETDDPPKPGEPQKSSAEQRLHAKLLWARTLLSLRPPQQGEARTLLESLVESNPNNAEAHYLLGRLLHEQGSWGPAEQHLTAAVRADDHLSSAQRELAGLLMQRGEFGKARELYTPLLKDEKDNELLIAAARAERLDGSPEKAIEILRNVHRQTGEISGKLDEELLGQRIRALLLIEHGGEAVNLLTGPVGDLGQLKAPTLVALLVRAHLLVADGPQKKAELEKARSLLSKIPKAQASDPDVRLAQAELLLAEGKRGDANKELTALVASLENVSPTSNGEDTALRQLAQKLLGGKKE